jgi:BREX system ATP-binding protein BrxC/D
VSVPAPRGGLPSGGAPMQVAEYVEFLDREYLATYVTRGGSAVKLMVAGDDAIAGELAEGLAGLRQADLLHIAVDAASTRVHMIDQLFAAISRQVDWVGLAGAVVRGMYDQSGFPAPEGNDLSVATVAAEHEVNEAELYRSVRRSLERAILDDDSLSHEFRVAMLRLCQERLGRGDVDASERDTVLGWLCAEKVPAAALRKVSLYAKVARHNARPLLVSLTRWIRRAGLGGLVLQLDLERLSVARRPPAGLRDGNYYSKAAVMDAYEVLRQLIDATDELEGLFVAVQIPPDLLTDEGRGLPAYTALHLRVADEVRDRRRPNPYAALTRVGVRLEAIR